MSFLEPGRHLRRSLDPGDGEHLTWFFKWKSLSPPLSLFHTHMHTRAQEEAVKDPTD